MKRAELCAVSALLCFCTGAQALDFEFGDVKFDIKNRASAAVMFRMQDRNPALLGKLNVPGQQNLCAPDDCLSLTGDKGPNQRLVNANGSFNGDNHDDGDMNYDKYDVTAALTRLNTDIKVTWGDLLVRVHGIGYYDPMNTNFKETHFNTLYQPATTRRTEGVERVYAKGGDLLDAYVQYAFNIGDHAGAISVGQQTIRWGESGLVAVNSVAEISPPSEVKLHNPGFEIGELFQPVPLVVFSIDLAQGLGVEALYEFGWKPVQVDAHGAFLSDIDAFGNNAGEPININLGQFPEDPHCRKKPNNPILSLISSTCDTARLLPLKTGEPPGGKQYGLKLNYFADWLNGGTELDFYYFHYHSRLPYLDIFAAEESCARNSATGAQAVIDCRGFNGTLNPTGLGLDPLHVDTVKLMVDYPQGINMFGVSFTTNVGSWSLAGEYSFRPNVPLQVQINDLAFAALQPTFPRQDQVVGTDAIPALGPILAGLGLSVNALTLPGARHAVPDYVETIYRGHDVQGGQFIPGYERMKVGQFDMTALQAFSNVLWADQIIFIGEVGFTHVLGMPAHDRLQFEGGGQGQTHASPGADGTGQPGPDGHDSTAQSFNPTQQRGGFGESFAWGLRSLIRGEYNNVVFGWTFMPTIIATWDVKGTAPYPIQNFVQGRHDVIGGTEIKITPDLTATVLYQWFLGGGQGNTRLDRDNIALSFAYSF